MVEGWVVESLSRWIEQSVCACECVPILLGIYLALVCDCVRVRLHMASYVSGAWYAPYTTHIYMNTYATDRPGPVCRFFFLSTFFFCFCCPVCKEVQYRIDVWVLGRSEHALKYTYTHASACIIGEYRIESRNDRAREREVYGLRYITLFVRTHECM